MISQLCMLPLPMLEQDPTVHITESSLALVLVPGEGEEAGIGDKITVRFKAHDESGKTLADSERRGLDLTFEAGLHDGDPIFEVGEGWREGEERLILLDDAEGRSLFLHVVVLKLEKTEQTHTIRTSRARKATVTRSR